MSRSVEREIPASEPPRWSLLLRATILVPLWAAVAIGLVILIRAMPGRATKWDYSIYYSSALAMREGMNPYTADLTPLAHSLGFELDQINHATDPPTFVMCFVPLTLLAPRTGFYVWTAINALAFLLALILLFRWTPGLGRDAALAIAALTILFPPVADHLVWGQNKMLVLLMFVLMLRWMERGRNAAAGLILAFAILLRAFPLLLVGYLVLMKRWRAVAYTMVGARRRRVGDRGAGGNGPQLQLFACTRLSHPAMGAGAAEQYRSGPIDIADVLVLLRRASRNHASVGE